MNSTRPFLAAVIFTTCLWAAGLISAAGCTPARDAAAKDLLAKKGQCALENLDRSPEQMLIDCAIPKDARDVQDIIDIFAGAQQSAVNAGAQLPHAQPGLKPRAKDAG